MVPARYQHEEHGAGISTSCPYLGAIPLGSTNPFLGRVRVGAARECDATRECDPSKRAPSFCTLKESSSTKGRFPLLTPQGLILPHAEPKSFFLVKTTAKQRAGNCPDSQLGLHWEFTRLGTEVPQHPQHPQGLRRDPEHPSSGCPSCWVPAARRGAPEAGEKASVSTI